MSYYGTRDQAKSDAKAASIQIDGLEPSATSPVRDGKSSDGAAPIEGPKEFTTERNRHGWRGNQNISLRREFPTEGVSRGKKTI